MKKILLTILLTLFIITISGCGDKVISKENGVTMTLTDEWKEVITYNGTIPSMTFEFTGAFNVYETSSEIGYIFTKNDNYLLSDAFSNHFNMKIKNNYIVTSKVFQELDANFWIYLVLSIATFLCSVVLFSSKEENKPSNILPNGEWICADCGKANPKYMYLCPCGGNKDRKATSDMK